MLKRHPDTGSTRNATRHLVLTNASNNHIHSDTFYALFPVLHARAVTCSSVVRTSRFHYAQHLQIPQWKWSALDAQWFYPPSSTQRPVVHEWRTEGDLWHRDTLRRLGTVQRVGSLEAHLVSTTTSEQRVFPAVPQALWRHEQREPCLERRKQFWPSHCEERAMRLLTLPGAPTCIVCTTVTDVMASPEHAYRSHTMGQLVVDITLATPAHVRACLDVIAEASESVRRERHRMF